MLPYAVTFIISIIGAIIIDINTKKDTKKGNRISMIIFIFISIVLSLLAALRDPKIGVDANTYVIPLFKWASGSDFASFLSNGGAEKGFLLLTWIISKLFNDYKILLFVIEFIITLGILGIGFKYRKKISYTILVVIFLLYIYTNTYTMMRQFIALVFVCVSYIEIYNKNYIKGVIYFGMALLFHYTSIIACVGFLFIIINNSGIRKKSLVNFFILFIIMITMIFYKEITYLFTHGISILPVKYYEYFTSKYYLDEGNISLFKLLFKLATIGIVWLYYKTKDNKERNIIISFFIIDFIIFIASSKLLPLLRLSYFFSYPAILYAFPKMIKDYDIINHKRTKRLLVVCTIGLMLLYWGIEVVRIGTGKRNGGNTYPYVFYEGEK